MRSARPIVAACLVSVAAWTGAAGGVAAHAAQCPGVKTSGHWATIRMPTWPAAPTDYPRAESGVMSDSIAPVTAAVDPLNPARLFVSNGQAVMRSTNGGCSWQLAFTLAPTGMPADGPDAQPWLDGSYVVQSIAVAGAGSTAHVYLALTGGVGYGAPLVNTAPVYVAASDDGGTSWTSHQVVVGDPLGRINSIAFTNFGNLMASPTSPATVYWDAVFHGRAYLNGSSDHLTLLVSHDAGLTWQVASTTAPRTASTDLPHWMSEVVDPANAHVLWRAFTRGQFSGGLDVLRSSDGGVKYRPALVGQPPGEKSFDPPYVTARSLGRGSCVVAHSPAAAFYSTNIGGRWTRLPLVPALDARSGRAYLEGASCAAVGRAVVLAGYQPQRFASPPFTRSALYVQARAGGAWKRLSTLRTALGEGSLTVAGPPSAPAVYWFGVVSHPVHNAPTPSDYIWLRYVGSLR
jgi:hypothetical protein